MQDLTRVADAIAKGGAPVVLRKAEITTVNTNATVKIKFAGGAEIDYDVPCLDPNEPTVGDNVWLIVQGSMMLALGYSHSAWEI